MSELTEEALKFCEDGYGTNESRGLIRRLVGQLEDYEKELGIVDVGKIRQIDDEDLVWDIITTGHKSSKLVTVKVYDQKNQTSGEATGKSEMLTKQKALAQLNIKSIVPEGFFR